MMKNIIPILLSSIIIYLLATLFIYFIADNLIYFPPHPANYHDNDDIIKLRTHNNGKSISAYYLPNHAARYIILVSHGNAEDIGSLVPFLKQLQQRGFAVFAYDYQGYGTSEGKPNEKNSYSDIDAAYTYLTEKLKIPEQQIIVYGRSLGAAVAMDLAVRHHNAGLILEAPFITAYRVVTHIPLFIGDQFNNLAKITKLNIPLLIIHGEKDDIVPIWHSKKLYQTATAPKQHFWVSDAGHNNVLLIAQENYWRAIRNFVTALQPQ